MCSYLPLLQKLPAVLVIRKVNVTKHHHTRSSQNNELGTDIFSLLGLAKQFFFTVTVPFSTMRELVYFESLRKCGRIFTLVTSIMLFATVS